MLSEFSRTQLVLGKQTMEKLKKCNIAIFGVGETGAMAAEALARCGIENFTLVDDADISEADISAQLIAMHSTVGRKKTETMKNRILEINPKAAVTVFNLLYNEENESKIPLTGYDYIIDTMGTAVAKLHLIQKAKSGGVPVISSMENGGTQVEAADISKAMHCPLAQEIKRELNKTGIKKLKIVYARENDADNLPHMPSIAGMVVAGEVVADLIQ